MAAIEERRELVQTLWFYGYEELATEHYVELRRLRAKMKELRNVDTRPNNPGVDGDQAAE